MKDNGSSTTISDIARAAKVSTSTVSLVLNSRPNVSDEIRQRVQKAIDRLQYRPRRPGRPSRSPATLRVGVINGRRSVRLGGQISTITEGWLRGIHQALARRVEQVV